MAWWGHWSRFSPGRHGMSNGRTDTREVTCCGWTGSIRRPVQVPEKAKLKPGALGPGSLANGGSAEAGALTGAIRHPPQLSR